MITSRVAEYIFFFSLLAGVAYLVWKLIAPFVGALALAAIIVTICYPMYLYVQDKIPGHNPTVASLVSVFLIILVVVLPLIVLGSFILQEALSIYGIFNNDTQFSLSQSLIDFEVLIQSLIPGFNLEVASYVRQFAGFVAEHVGAIFAGTASTIFLFFIALIGSFYFFRDGKEFSKYLIQISPLPDDQDEKILKRLAVSVRSVAMGTVLVALIQGTITGIGLWLFGFERAVLWGSAAAIGALIPGVGTTIVFLPAVIYLIVTGSYVTAGGLAIWGILAVGLIDNILGPHLMGRGNKIHPFLILLSVLGGITLFGPIGFVLGPVTISFFTVLLELYSLHIKKIDEPT